MIIYDIWWYLMIFGTLFVDPSPKTGNAVLTNAQRSQIEKSWFLSILIILFESSCCPERTVLGSDGNSVVYQLASGFVLFMIFVIILVITIQLTTSSRAIHGGAYFSAVFGRKFNPTTVLRPCQPLACYWRVGIAAAPTLFRGHP